MSTINKIKIEDVLYEIEDKEAREILENLSTGGSKEWKLIRTVTIPEDITTDTSGVNFAYASADAPENGIRFGFDTDENGEAFSCTELIVYTEKAGTPSTLGSASLNFDAATPGYGGGGFALAGVVLNSKTGYGVSRYEKINDGKAFTYRATFGGGSANSLQTSGKIENSITSPITKMRGYIANGSVYGFLPNSKFIIIGR